MATGEDVKIVASIETNTAGSVKSINEYKASIDAAKKAIADLEKEKANAKVGSKEFEEATKKIAIANKELTKQTVELNAATASSGGVFGQLKKGLTDLVPGIKAAESGAQSFGTQLWQLVKNPIGLIITGIVLGLKFLYEAFTSTKDGANKMEVVFAAVSSVIKNLTDRAMALGRGLIAIFSGDFKKMAEEFNIVAGNAGNSLVQSTKAAMDAQERMQKLKKAMANQEVEDAKNAAKIAKLREDAMDLDIPLAKRKAAQKEVEKFDKESSDRKIANAKEQQAITLQLADSEANGRKKRAQEIRDNEIAVQNSITEGANTARRIDKQGKALDREAAAKEKEEAQKEKEAKNAELMRQKEYVNKLTALQNETNLAIIIDGYAKEKEALVQKYKDEKTAFDQSLKEGKIKKVEYDNLIKALDANNKAKNDELDAKHKKETEDKEQAFQEALAKLRTKTMLDGMTDTREKEKFQLKFEYEDKLLAAQKQYKDDATKFQIFKAALDADLKAKQDALDAKNLKEDKAKKLGKDLSREDKILADPKATIDAKKMALDLETSIIKQAFEDKILTEQEYTDKVNDLSNKRKEIVTLEEAHKKKQAEESADVLGKLSDLVGKQTAAGKALAIAQATINTWTGVTEALKQKSTLPSPFDFAAKAVNVAAILASGFKAVKNIVSVQVPGGGGGGSAPSMTPPAPVTPQQASTSLNAASIQGVGNAAAGGVNRNFVLDADINNAQDRAARLNRAARLG